MLLIAMYGFCADIESLEEMCTAATVSNWMNCCLEPLHHNANEAPDWKFSPKKNCLFAFGLSNYFSVHPRIMPITNEEILKRFEKYFEDEEDYHFTENEIIECQKSVNKVTVLLDKREKLLGSIFLHDSLSNFRESLNAWGDRLPEMQKKSQEEKRPLRQYFCEEFEKVHVRRVDDIRESFRIALS